MDRLDNALSVASLMENRKRITRTIYLLKCNEFYKIGYASFFKQRIHLYKFEDYIFKVYATKLHHGEWFTLSQEDIDHVLARWF